MLISWKLKQCTRKAYLSPQTGRGHGPRTRAVAVTSETSGVAQSNSWGSTVSPSFFAHGMENGILLGYEWDFSVY